MLEVISNNYSSNQSWKKNGTKCYDNVPYRRNNFIKGVPPAFKTKSNFKKKKENNDAGNTLAFYKRSPLILPENQIRPYNGKCCSTCCPLSQHSLVEDINYALGINSLFHVPARNRSFLLRWCCYFHHSAFVKHPWKYRSVTNNEVLQSPLVKDAIEKTVSQELDKFPPGKVDFKKVEKKANKSASTYYQNFKTVISVNISRITSWVLLNVFSRLFKSVLFHKGQLCTLEQGMKTSTPIIYIPTHRSHVDYLLLTLVLFVNGLRMPYVAAGINLNIPVIGWVLKKLGAIYIRRRLEKDQNEKDFIYRSTLQLYFENMLYEGNDIEFFIEGGRTRSGKITPPKGGLLSVVVKAVEKQIIPDALIVPVTINYDRNVDGEFISEQLGEPKNPESFLGFLKSAWRVLRKPHGNVRMDFGQPFSLKEFINKSSSYSLPAEAINLVCGDKKQGVVYTRGCSMTSLSDADRETVSKLSCHISYNLAMNFPILSTNVVSSVILSKFRTGGSINNLIKWCEFCRNELFHKQKDIGFAGETSDVVRYALDLFGQDIIKFSTKEAFAVTNFTVSRSYRDHILLNFYANSLYMFFNLESIAAICVLRLLNQSFAAYVDSNIEFKISEVDLVTSMKDLCELLSMEFSFSAPCTPVDANIENVLERFCQLGVLTKIHNIVNSSKYGDMSDDELWDEEKVDYKVTCSQRGIEILQFFAGFLSPMIYNYYVTCTHLSKLVQTEMGEEEVLKAIQDDIKRRLVSESLVYGECCSLETVKNALKYFIKIEVLEQYDKENTRTFYLSADNDTETAVLQLVQHVFKYVL